MASITIPNIDEAVEARLRERATRYGRTLEEEALEMMKAGLAATGEEPRNLYEAIRRFVEPFGGVELEIPPREPVETRVDFSDFPE